jgi:hypothetical protein
MIMSEQVLYTECNNRMPDQNALTSNQNGISMTFDSDQGN